MASLESFNTNSVNIEEIFPHIYHIKFTSSYDLAMHFLRFQEYYESPKFYRQFFTIIDYMEWYAKEYEQKTGAFTYPIDWAGFNVPSKCLIPFLEEPCPIPDPNKYDEFMLRLINYIKEKEGNNNFYLIGTKWINTTFDFNNCLEHELSHAWYTIDENYKTEMDKLLNNLPSEVLFKAREYLNKNNYHTSTIDDEIVAYCATGLSLLREIIPSNLTIPFRDFFQSKKKI